MHALENSAQHELHIDAYRINGRLTVEEGAVVFKLLLAAPLAR